MVLSVDKFGRVLIPKRVRRLLGLQPGTNIELKTNEEEGLLIFRVPKLPAKDEIILTKYGLPIIQNGPVITEDFDTVDFIKSTRAAYLDRKLGLDA